MGDRWIHHSHRCQCDLVPEFNGRGTPLFPGSGALGMDGMGWGGVRTGWQDGQDGLGWVRTGWQDGQDGLGVGADRMGRMGWTSWEVISPGGALPLRIPKKNP